MHFYGKEKLLQPSQLKRLAEHKYSCQNISILGELNIRNFAIAFRSYRQSNTHTF